ncbi:ATP-binding cassette domain-containing protein [Dactylosporangium sp. CA-139114]|uniref:ATP-binding cassette domain-containing protein n=1 Tax=Dactylosporangium sp. CA-139114 TaxID=3239931 RepID=UPI003D9898E3
MNGITVDVRGVTHRYGGATVLDEVDLRIVAGSRHGIVGANGAGKTTLLGLVAGTGRPTTGRIIFDGRDVTHLPLHRRAKLGMSRTWQYPAVVDSLTAADNVALALRGVRLGAARKVATELLDDAGIAGQHLAGELPYGRRRILELLIALAPRPRLLVLDEPSAGLDDREITDLLQRLLGMAADTTVVFTDHSDRLVTAIADTVTVLDRGRHLVTSPPAAVSTATAAAPAVVPSTASPAGVPVPSTASESLDKPAGEPVLRLVDLHVGYQSHHVLHGLNLRVFAGEVVAVSGVDGAGRTTLVDAVAGTLRAWPPSRIQLAGDDITALTAATRARAGLGTVPQRRMPIPSITVADQLRLAGVDASQLAAELTMLTPWLHHRAHQQVDALSGGERQILAVTCAAARHPRVLLLDECTEGMAPPVIARVRQLIRALAASGTAVLFTDSPHGPLLDTANRVLRLRHGHIEPAL